MLNHDNIGDNTKNEDDYEPQERALQDWCGGLAMRVVGGGIHFLA